MAAVELSAGSVFGEERYTLKRRLGVGGMASVWLADDERLGRQVAVKVIADAFASDERYRQRFEREARAAAAVSHPNIVPVYDYGLQGEHPYLVMEYVTGGSLADVFSRGGSIVPSPSGLAGELLGALDCVHGAGLVHRDIKPANILLDDSGRARLTDFGIAQPEDATSLTQTGMVVGTLRYLAPEVIAGGKATPAADLYAAGVVLRELAERHPAPELSALIAALIATHPDDRPSSAAAALQLLGTAPTQALAATGPTRIIPATAAPPSPPKNPSRTSVPTSRRDAPGGPRLAGGGHTHGISPRAAALATAVALALLVIFIISTSRGGNSPSTRNTTATPPATSANAPLADQLSSLRQLVNHAVKP